MNTIAYIIIVQYLFRLNALVEYVARNDDTKDKTIHMFNILYSISIFYSIMQIARFNHNIVTHQSVQNSNYAVQK